jgi:hypothetical protein
MSNKNELSKAIDTAETWVDCWIDNIDVNDPADECDMEEMDAIKAIQLLIKTCKGIERLQSEPEDCPHAAPHRYCSGCKVTPCPIGLS